MDPFPVIDTSPLTTDPADPATVALIASSCEQHGFLVIAGHGVPDDLIADIERVTREFFHLSEADKSRFGGPTPVGQLGYRALGRTRTAASLGEQSAPDLVETFGIKNVDPATKYAAHNFWPPVPADFQAVWSAYWHAMTAVQNLLLHAFEAALDLPAGWFSDKLDKAGTSLKANFYPAQQGTPLPGQRRRGAHTDFGFMTLLYRDSTPGGLQVEVSPGTWIDVPNVPGTLIVNVADLLAHWTNGRWKSSMHRVTNPAAEDAGRERISIPFFVDLNEDAVITTIPGCDDGAAVEPVTAGDWVKAKFAAMTVAPG